MDELVKLLGNELYSQVKSKIGERGLIIDTGMLIPKHRFDCVNISLKEHKQTVISQKQRIAELERIAEEFTAVKRRNEQLSDEVIILTEIGKCGVKNILTVRPLINTGERHGAALKKSVCNQLKNIMSAQPYLCGESRVSYMLVPCAAVRNTENKNE